MKKINWLEEVEKRKDALLKDAVQLIQIKSVLDEQHATDDAPLGKGVRDALLYMLKKGEQEGFITKNVDQLAGHIEFGEGKELVGILCHVDVVPEGEGWTYPPYEGVIKDGKLYGRGALDDKGPTMAAFYAMKIVKELNLPLTKRVQMIIGTDEESEWRCVTHYFQKEEMPNVGFAPDADFPIIFAEKGIADFDLIYHGEKTSENETFEVIEFVSGRRYNMVPDDAKAVLFYREKPEEITENFADFLKTHSLEGKVHMDEHRITFTIKGKSAHAMEPKNGVNAGLYLASFLANEQIDKKAKPYFTFIYDYLFQDTRGKKLQIDCKDDLTGELTMNIGIFTYHRDQGGKIGFNFRYPVHCQIDQVKERITEIAQRTCFQVGHFSDSKPHHVDPKDPLIKTLQRVYEEQTGEKAELLSIGGGTYARSLKSGVAFGPLFPGRPDIAHQKDEYIDIDDLLRATAIYAQAIYELAKE
ncbi:dipeptidase PepV [Fervidibacillus halotolerans]|uniref:Dipeptidase PepV n=1 Tax=Fervidibacillus halotolerans TaxID=2980027 RepID=A0A9E8RY21_9BACI|nr:dipeptidase PepV [Fervidibacillus halotolerans]WAA11763.1 dipeptidase PepV [Fervidibacillus halotolerans]